MESFDFRWRFQQSCIGADCELLTDTVWLQGKNQQRVYSCVVQWHSLNSVMDADKWNCKMVTIDGTHHQAEVDGLPNRRGVPWGALLNSSQDRQSQIDEQKCDCKMVTCILITNVIRYYHFNFSLILPPGLCPIPPF
jgi:hypothetical protein